MAKSLVDLRVHQVDVYFWLEKVYFALVVGQSRSVAGLKSAKRV